MANESLHQPAPDFSAEMQRLLRTASQQPWGPGREIDEKVYHLHQALLGVMSRLGREGEQPSDAELAHRIDHDLRNKLMIFHYHEQKRSTPPMPIHRPRASRRRKRTQAKLVQP